MINVKAHSIDKIIGSPLVSLIKAECQSAAATVEFIRDIGFESSKEDSLGNLRMITFCYEKRNSSGNMQKFKMEVPLLSLIQIPILKIKDAKIDFGIKVVSVNCFKNEDAHDEKLDIKGFIAPSSSNNKYSQGKHIGVSINLEQGDLPLGVINLINTMNDSIKIVPDSDEK